MQIKSYVMLTMATLSLVSVQTAHAEETPWTSTDNCLVAASATDNANCWSEAAASTSGDATIDTTKNLVTLKSTEDESASVAQTVTLDTTKTTGQYFVFASLTKADDEVGGITGVPYLYGYAMNDAGTIEDYLQGQQMRFDGEYGSWDVSYGIYELDATTTEIQFFLNQGLHADYEYTGTPAYFKNYAGYVVSSEEEAYDILSLYQDQLGSTETKALWKSDDNCLVATNVLENKNCWLNYTVDYGDVTVDDDTNSVVLRSTTEQSAYTVHKIDVEPTTVAGKYLVFASLTKADDEVGSITGLPYLYGYQINSAGRITDYLQDSHRIFDGEFGAWDVSYGIYELSEDTSEISYFMKQGLSASYDYTGTPGYFKNYGVYIVDSQAEAEALVKEYNHVVKKMYKTSDTPIKAVAVSKTDTGVNLKWDGLNKAKRYQVRVLSADGSTKIKTFKKVTDTSKLIANLAGDNKYIVRVRAVYEDTALYTYSRWSKPVTVTLK